MRRPRRHYPPRGSRERLPTWLTLLAVTLGPLLLTACSCPTVAPEPVRPPLPAGRPPERSAELMKAQAGWVYSGGMVIMPQTDSRRLLKERGAWRSWAAALEASVAWSGSQSQAEGGDR